MYSKCKRAFTTRLHLNLQNSLVACSSGQNCCLCLTCPCLPINILQDGCPLRKATWQQIIGLSKLHCSSQVTCVQQKCIVWPRFCAMECIIRAGLLSKTFGDPTWDAYLFGFKGMFCHCDMWKHLALENFTCILDTLLLGDSNSGATFPDPVQGNLRMMRGPEAAAQAPDVFARLSINRQLPSS